MQYNSGSGGMGDVIPYTAEVVLAMGIYTGCTALKRECGNVKCVTMLRVSPFLCFCLFAMESYKHRVPCPR